MIPAGEKKNTIKEKICQLKVKFLGSWIMSKCVRIEKKLEKRKFIIRQEVEEKH